MKRRLTMTYYYSIIKYEEAMTVLFWREEGYILKFLNDYDEASILTN